MGKLDEMELYGYSLQPIDSLERLLERPPKLTFRLFFAVPPTPYVGGRDYFLILSMKGKILS